MRTLKFRQVLSALTSPIFFVLFFISAQSSFALGVGFQCRDIFDSTAYTALHHLFEPTFSTRRGLTPSVKVVQFLSDGSIVLKRKALLLGWFGQPRSRPWSDDHLIKFDIRIPQGDVRSFIYLAGPALAKKFGIYFLEKNGEVLLVAPTAKRLEKTVRALNMALARLGRVERIAYLPKEFGFAKPGELLGLANMKDEQFSVQFPYMDIDPVQLLHELSYHLGAMLFPEAIHEKSREINLEYARINKLLLGLPTGQIVAEHLTKIREDEIDVCNGNLALELTNWRERTLLSPFSKLNFSSIEASALIAEINGIAHPYFSPTEIVAIELIKLLGMQRFFVDRPELFAKELRSKYIVGSSYLLLPPSEVEHYRAFVTQLLAEQTAQAVITNEPNSKSIPPRTQGSAVLANLLQTMDQRLETFLAVFDEIEPIQHHQERKKTLMRRILGN